MESSATEAFVRVEDLRRVHRVGSEEVRALDGVDLRVGAGEIVAIVGVSGSGKSTLLHLLGGLDRPSAGSIQVGGLELSRASKAEQVEYRRRRVGFVFQSFHLVPSASALGNVELALAFQGVRGQERRRRAEQALDTVGLSSRVHHRPRQLSGGEQQRVAIARAIVHRPPLLLADEPTGNLDRGHSREVNALLSRVREEFATTVLLVTHDEESAREISDRRVRLRDGRVVEESRA